MPGAALIAAAALAAIGPSVDAKTGPIRLLFSSNRTGVPQIYSVSPSGTGLGQLTFDAEGGCDPRPSPNGRWIVFSRAQRPLIGDPSCGPGGELWLMRANGEARRRIRLGSDPAWHRDSRRIAFTGPSWVADPGIHAIDATTGTGFRRVTTGQDSRPAWSPDGQRIMFLRAVGERGETALLVRRGGVERNRAPSAYAATWSPKGRWIAYTVRPAAGPAELHVVRPDGSGGRRLTTFAPGPFPPGLKWSPGGRFIALADVLGIRLVSLATGQARTLHRTPPSELAWSPAGDAVVLTEYPFGSIVRVGLDGTARTLIVATFADALRGLGWTRPPAGTAYRAPEAVAPLAEAQPRELALRVPSAGQGIQELTADGDRVAFTACRHVVAVWRPGEASVTPVARYGPNGCRFPAGGSPPPRGSGSMPRRSAGPRASSPAGTTGAAMRSARTESATCSATARCSRSARGRRAATLPRSCPAACPASRDESCPRRCGASASPDSQGPARDSLARARRSSRHPRA